MPPSEWDAATYDRIADPQTRWGAEVLERLELRGGERVLDAGCGSGRVTELLLARLPRGRVVALDGSSSMIVEARRRLAEHADRVEFVVADLMQPLHIEPVDAILSTATFHWIPDHDSLFANLAEVLEPGGQLVAQCGGASNLATVEEALRRLGATGFVGKMYSSAEATAARLARSGFVEIRCWLSDEPTPFGSASELERFLSTVVLREHIAGMPSREADAFVRDVVERLPALELDYMRLNILARRAG